MREIQIEVHPRVHLGLISMHEDAPRRNGGIGFAIEGPTASIVVRRADRFSLSDLRSRPMTADELNDLGNLLKSFATERGITQTVSVQITGEMRTHIGMGSATGIRLGALECLAILNELEVSTDVLIAASGRGGTSGVGINTYFKGGFICDLGGRNDGRAYVPSSRAMPDSPPLAMPVLGMGAWPMLLAISRSVVPKTQLEEIEFFERMTPLPKTASFEASYVAFFEIYAAVAERNYKAFCRGVNAMQKTAWKRAEREEYGKPLQILTEKMLFAGADCVGMSSLGPMLFCFVRPENLSAFTRLTEDLDCDMYQTMPRNEGRTVKRAYA